MTFHRAFLGDPEWNWSFPEAFQPQYDFKTEWWWYGGHCYDGDRRFSFHAVLFRFSNPPDCIEDEPKWSSQWIAQWGITDHKGLQYYTGEIPITGFTGKLDGHWNGISCSNDGSGLHLKFSLGNPVLQGERGVTQKGPGLGDASYHFACPQSRCQGQLRLGNDVFSVRGGCWFDREIGSDMFGGKPGSWEWVCLSLNNGERKSHYALNPDSQVGTSYLDGYRLEPLHQEQFPSKLTAPYHELPCRIWKDQRQVGWGFLERASGVLV